MSCYSRVLDFHKIFSSFLCRVNEIVKFNAYLVFFLIQVVNDGDMNLWRELGVNSWPTFAVVGPNGKLLAQLAGEGHRKVLIAHLYFSCTYIAIQLFVAQYMHNSWL